MNSTLKSDSIEDDIGRDLQYLGKYSPTATETKSTIFCQKLDDGYIYEKDSPFIKV